MYLSTHTVGYNGSSSTVNETNCNKKESKKKCELTSESIRMRTTMKNLEMKTNISILCVVGQLERWRSNLRRKLLVIVVFVFVDLDGWVLRLILLIRGVRDFSS